jgi:hypothetical protein
MFVSFLFFRQCFPILFALSDERCYSGKLSIKILFAELVEDLSAFVREEEKDQRN